MELIGMVSPREEAPPMGTITYWNMPHAGARPIFEAPMSETWEGPKPRMLVQERGTKNLSLEPVRWFGRRWHIDEVEVGTEIEEDLFVDGDWVKNSRRVNRWAHQAIVRLQEEHFGDADIHVVFRQPPCFFGGGGTGDTGLMFAASIFDGFVPTEVNQNNLMGGSGTGPPMLEPHELTT